MEGVRGGSELKVPPGALDVTIDPAVTVRVSSEETGIRIPHIFRQVILPGTRQVVEMLRPCVMTACD